MNGHMAPELFKTRGRSEDHFDSVELQCSINQTNNKTVTVDAMLGTEFGHYKLYWREVLRTVVEYFEFLCENGLVLKGNNEEGDCAVT
jgi:hypothetical protein